VSFSPRKQAVSTPNKTCRYVVGVKFDLTIKHQCVEKHCLSHMDNGDQASSIRESPLCIAAATAVSVVGICTALFFVSRAHTVII